MIPVRCRALERRFGRRVALAGVDLDVGPGEIVGLVGPNGSGKTTLLKVLAGFLRPDAGTAAVLGREPFRERAAVMRRARFAFAPPALFASLTAREHLERLTRLGGERVARADIDGALETVGLAERADDRVRAYSFGMRQRLALAQALVPLPELVVLDEPTDGLDPLAVLELRAVLARLRAEHGIAVLLSSHLLVEVEELVDRMLVLAEGRPVFAGPPAELVAGGERLRLEVSDAERACARLGAAGMAGVAVVGPGVVELAPGALTLARAQELLREAGVELEGFVLRRPTLEQALLARLREARR